MNVCTIKANNECMHNKSRFILKLTKLFLLGFSNIGEMLSKLD